jgi:O-antigen ligase
VPVSVRLPPWASVVLAALAVGAGFALSPNVIGPAMAIAALLWAAYRWPLMFVVLTIWTTVIPTVYAFQVGAFGLAPYVLLETVAVIGIALRWMSGRITLVVPQGVGWLIVHVGLTSLSALLASDGIVAASMLVRLWLNWLMVFLVLAVVPDRPRLMQLLGALLLHAFIVVGVSVGSSLSNLNLPSFPSLLFLHFQKNDYATYLSFVVALAVIAFAAKPGDVFGKIAGVALLVMVAVSWPLTYSRSGLLSLIGMLLTVAILYRTRRLFGVLAVVVLVAATTWRFVPSEAKTLAVRAVESLISPGAGEHDSFEDTYEDRVMLNWAAVDSISQKPLLGVGLGEWVNQSPLQVAIWDVKKEGVVSMGANIHNRYLLIAAESGVGALLGYLGFVGVLLIAALRIRRRSDAWMKLLLSSLIACTAGFLVSNLFVPGTLWEWNLLAVLATTLRIAAQETANGSTVRPWRPRLVGDGG